jgi:catalase (peroxidase I)
MQLTYLYLLIDIKNLFGGRFGMSVAEVVAIMGGHSVGRTTFSESGFDGGWTPFQSSFSNQYFKALGIFNLILC